MIGLDSLYEGYLACCNERRFDDLARYVHDEITFNGQATSRADYAQAIASNIEAVPDFRWTVEGLVTSGDTIAVRLTDRGTPGRDWLGIPPTGRSFEIAEFATYHVRDGRIAAMWFLLDQPTAARQVGGA